MTVVKGGAQKQNYHVDAPRVETLGKHPETLMTNAKGVAQKPADHPEASRTRSAGFCALLSCLRDPALRMIGQFLRARFAPARSGSQVDRVVHCIPGPASR
jgi:hypothetical protein